MRAGEFPTSPEPIADGVAAQATPVWPMVVGLAIAAWVLDFLVSWLRRGSMGRVGLVVLTSMLLFTAVMVCGFVVRTVYARLLPRGRIPAAPVVRAACLTALWIPAWVLFVETSSLLMIAAGVMCLLSLGYFLKRCEVEMGPATVQPTRRESWMPFMFEGTPLVRALLPSLLLVLLFDAAIGLAANYRFILSSVMAGAFAGVLAWRAAARRRLTPTALAATPRAVVSSGRQGVIVAAAFVFTAIAMLPFLRVSPLGGFSMAFGKKGETKKSAAVKEAASPSDGYVGIILLPMTDPQRKIVAPVKRTLVPNFGVRIAEPMEIPFDGQYWYFKAPEKKPRPTAKVVRGSSTKTQVSSSDSRPLLMEAHQKLAEPLDLGCCSAMDLVVENADRMEGAIALELWVKKLPDVKAAAKQRVNAVAPEQAPHYLGTVVIPSSELPLVQRPNASGKPVEEKLRFPIPEAMDGTTFDEITVVVKQAPERARMGAKVAIRKFVLEP